MTDTTSHEFSMLVSVATMLAFDRALAKQRGITPDDAAWPIDCPACLRIHGQGQWCPIPALRPEYV